MNTDQLLNQIDDIIDSGSKTLRGGKVAVDAEAIRSTLEEIRLGLPKEISQAKIIVADRNNLLSKAKQESVKAVTAAQEKSRALVAAAEDKVRNLVLKTDDYCKNRVTEAEAKANKIVSSANDEAAEIRSAAKVDAAQMVDDSIIVIAAKDKADEINSDASAQAEKILSDAKTQAEVIVAAAVEKANLITSNAQTEEKDLIEKSNKWSAEIRAAADDYVDSVLRNADVVLTKSLNDIQSARNSFLSARAQETQSEMITTDEEAAE